MDHKETRPIRGRLGLSLLAKLSSFFPFEHPCLRTSSYCGKNGGSPADIGRGKSCADQSRAAETTGRITKFLLVAATALVFLGPLHAKETGLIFVSNEKSNSISVIDPKSLEVVKIIKTSRRPRDMEFNQTHTLLFVAAGDDDVIDVINIEKLEVVDSIPTGASPEVFFFSPDGRLIYVSNEEDSSLSVIDIAEKIVIEEIPTGAEPEGVILSEDGKIAYVTSEVSDMVHVIDTEGLFVVENIIVGTRPRRFALTPDGKELWVSTELSGEVYIIDRKTLEVTDVVRFLPPGFRRADVTPVEIEISRDGRTGYVTLGRANHIAYVNTATREVEDYVLVGKRAWGLAYNADESRLYVTNGLSDDVTVIDNRKRKAIKSIAVGRVPHTVIIDD